MRVTSRLTNGMIGGQSYEISKEESAKMGSIERRSFMKLSYRPKPADVLNNDDRCNQDFDNVESEMVQSTSMSDNSTATYADNVECSTHEQSNEKAANVSGHDRAEVDEISHGCSDANQDFTSHEEDESDDNKVDRGNHQEHIEPKTKVDVMNHLVSNLEELSNSRWLSGEASHDKQVAKEMEMTKRREEERELNAKVAKMEGWSGFDAVFMISAKLGDGVGDFMVRR